MHIIRGIKYSIASFSPEVDTNFATALASLNSLTKLTLSQTSLHQLPDNFLIGLSSLRDLDISFNQGLNFDQNCISV